MAYPALTRDDLAKFTGRPAASFPETFITESAIPQATLLFKLGTCILDPELMPPDAQQLTKYAIIAMADAIHLSAPYQTALASPFNSESIGSYSYSKTAAAVQKGDATGIMWFDMAVQQLSMCDRTNGDFMGGGIEVFENGAAYVVGHQTGNVRFLSPADLDASRSFGWDPPRQLVYGL